MNHSSDVIRCFTILPIEMGGRDVYDILNISLVPWEWPELVHGGAYQIQEVGR